MDLAIPTNPLNCYSIREQRESCDLNDGGKAEVSLMNYFKARDRIRVQPNVGKRHTRISSLFQPHDSIKGVSCLLLGSMPVFRLKTP